jgi:hypothetical protein
MLFVIAVSRACGGLLHGKLDETLARRGYEPDEFEIVMTAPHIEGLMTYTHGTRAERIARHTARIWIPLRPEFVIGIVGGANAHGVWRIGSAILNLATEEARFHWLEATRSQSHAVCLANVITRSMRESI